MHDVTATGLPQVGAHVHAEPDGGYRRPVRVDAGAPFVITGRDGVLTVWLGGCVAAYGGLTAEEAAEALEGLAGDIRSGELRWVPRPAVVAEGLAGPPGGPTS